MFGGGSVTSLAQAEQAARTCRISGGNGSPIVPGPAVHIGNLPGKRKVHEWQGSVRTWRQLRREVVRAPARRSECGDRAARRSPNKLAAAGSGEPFATTPNEMAALIRADDERFGRVIKASGLKVE